MCCSQMRTQELKPVNRAYLQCAVRFQSNVGTVRVKLLPGKAPDRHEAARCAVAYLELDAHGHSERVGRWVPCKCGHDEVFAVLLPLLLVY